jgi:hypothetical protein
MLDWLADVAPARHSRYLVWSENRQDMAQKLYQMNLKVSEAWYLPLHTLEILVRNKTFHHLNARCGENWLINPNFIRLPEHQKDVQEVIRRYHCENDWNKIVAELKFSFWTGLFSRQYNDLWRNKGLRFIFQNSDLQRAEIAHKLKEIRILRNRVAHYEPILQLPLLRLHTDLTEICGWLEPRCLTWLRSNSRVLQIHPTQQVIIENQYQKEQLNPSINL